MSRLLCPAAAVLAAALVASNGQQACAAGGRPVAAFALMPGRGVMRRPTGEEEQHTLEAQMRSK